MKKKLLGVIIAVAGLALVAGCSTGNKDGDAATVRIGSKDFTENLLVGELYALALEDQGFTVERVPNIASSVIHTSIVNDEIDLYPEYTGTGLLSVLQLPMETDPQKVYDVVKEEYAKEFDLTWLAYAQANDSQGLVIRTEVAEKLNIHTISDLQAHASELRFASQGEFDQREDGMPGLEEAYGTFDWKSSTVYDNSLKYEVLKNDKADVTPAYTTEGQLVNTELYTLLEDDKQFWPPYNLAPVVRQQVLADNPKIGDILDDINKQLDTATMTELNAKVDVEGEEYEEVAQTFYSSLQ